MQNIIMWLEEYLRRLILILNFEVGKYVLVHNSTNINISIEV